MTPLIENKSLTDNSMQEFDFVQRFQKMDNPICCAIL